MELKRSCMYYSFFHSKVLIVPSGIETWKALSEHRRLRVLIVPSGIETTAKTPVIPTSGGINCT